MIVEIWGKSMCTFCDAAIQLCESEGVEYEYKTYEIDFTKEEILAEFEGATTFPQIKIDGNPIGGYVELKEILCR
jgi:glutaredoxin